MELEKFLNSIPVFFNYSTISIKPVNEGCRLLVMDEISKEVFFNESFDNIFKIEEFEYPELEKGSHYNYTTNQIIPVIFKSEGK